MSGFQQRLFVVLLLLSLVPAAAILGGATLMLREMVAAAGTAGPWDEVADSGRRLLEVVDARLTDDPEAAAAAQEHRSALSESLRLSRIYAFLGDRFLSALPFVGGGIVLLVALLSFVAARYLARSLSRPVEELVGWTERIGRREPLPATRETDDRGAREFRRLRRSLRAMAQDLETAHRKEVESARLRSWIEMARGVAHEIKNPLSPMRMAASRVARSDEPRLAEAGQVLLEEIDELDEMARSFSQLGRPPGGPPAEVDVVAVLQELLARLDVGDHRIVLEAGAGAPRVMGRYDALGRVFRNLVMNALEAAGAGHADGEPGAEPVRVRVEDGDGEVMVRVLDRGPGLPEADGVADHRIWEPGFSTKGRGTGLGLFLVRRTVEAHGGRAEARSREGGGAEFRITLPAAEAP